MNKPPFLFVVPRKQEEPDGLVVAIKLGPLLVIFARSASDRSTQGEMIADAFEELMSRDQILALAKKAG